MRADYRDVWFREGQEILGARKQVELPFGRISARAIVLRRTDGAILGTLHRLGGRFAFPGGAVEDGESTLATVQRELAEERIDLENPSWSDHFVVDYFEAYRELSVWHIVLTDGAVIGESEENVQSRWVGQGEDVWYPTLREKLVLALARYFPELLRVSIAVGDV